MKKTILHLFIFVTTLFLSACSDNSSNTEPEILGPETKIELGEQTSSLIFKSIQDEKGIKFKTSEMWQAKILEGDWLTVSPSSGSSGSSEITVMAQANELTENRTGRIAIITAHDKVEIDALQMQKDAIVVSKPSYTIDEKGGEIQLELGHNVEYDVLINVDWISKNSSRVYETDKISFQIAENAGYENREGKVSFISKDKSIRQDVKVYQTHSNALIVSPTKRVFDSETQKFDIVVKSTVDFTVKESENSFWLHREKSRGLTSHTLQYQLDENTTAEARTAEIIIKSTTDDNLTEKVTVIQMQAGALVNADRNYEIGPDKDTLSFEVITTRSFDVAVEGKWITQLDKSINVGDKIRFSIEKNTDRTARKGNISFVSKDGKSKQVIEISQKSWNTIKVNSRYVPMDWEKLQLKECNPVQGTYSFSSTDPTYKPNLNVGSVFVVDVDTMAYIGVVKEIEQNGSTTSVTSLPGSLRDIFGNTEIVLSTGSTPSTRNVANVFYPSQVSYKKDGKIQTVNYNLTRGSTHLTDKLWKWKSDFNTGLAFEDDNYSLSFEGSKINLSLDYELRLNFGGFEAKEFIADGVKRFLSGDIEAAASISGQCDFYQGIQFKAKGEASYKSKDKPWIENFVTDVDVRFVVYGVPVIVKLGADLYKGCSLSTEGDIETSTGVSNSSSLKVGMEYSQKSNKVKPIHEVANKLELTPPTVSGKGKIAASAWIYPKIKTHLYNAAGPSFEVKPYADASVAGGFKKSDLNSSDNFSAWNFDSGIGMNYDASIDFQFLKIELSCALSDFFSDDELSIIKRKTLYKSPVDLEFVSSDPKEVKEKVPMEVNFAVYDHNFLCKEKKMKTPLPQIVKFEGEGKLESEFGIAKNGIVTAQWIPSSSASPLSAIIYDENGEELYKATFNNDPLRPYLVKLFNDTKGESWIDNTNWCSEKPITEWYGVHEKDGKIEINLENNNLVGTVTFVNEKQSESDSPLEVIRQMNFSENGLTGINVSGCSKLEELVISKNSIKTLDISRLHSLKHLNCFSNPISSLDLTKADSLEYLNVARCQITELDLANKNTLKSVDAGPSSYLRKIDLENCKNLYQLYLEGGSKLESCIISGCFNLNSIQVFHCPVLKDFRMEGHYTNFEFFTVFCNCDLWTSLDLSACTKLKFVQVSGTRLTSLNLGNCNEILNFVVEAPLQSLRLGNLSKLEGFYLDKSSLKSIDLSSCSLLEHVVVGDNSKLYSLKLNRCNALSSLSLRDNPLLTDISLSGCNSLKDVSFVNNGLGTIDVSGLTHLSKLYCTGERIQMINVQGCRSIQDLGFRRCPNLRILNAQGCTSLQDLNLNSGLKDLNLRSCTSLKNFSINSNLQNLNVQDCTSLAYLGFEGNSSLQNLNVQGCRFIYLDFRRLPSLRKLNAQGCTSLEDLYLNSGLKDLNLRSCTSLKNLSTNSNLQNLNVQDCTSLTYLGFGGNSSLQNLNVQGCRFTSLKLKLPSLQVINVQDCNLLKDLDVEDCPNLSSFICGDNPSLKTFYCKGTKIKSQIPSWFSWLRVFSFDWRFIYKEHHSKENPNFLDRGYGWWRPGEPYENYDH